MTFEWVAYSDAAIREAFALREEVFVAEQGFAPEDELDEQDRTALHVLGRDESGRAVCTARMFAERPGVYHAGRIAVRRALRGQGVGRALMDEVTRRAKELGASELTLGAQYDKAGFYEAVGFVRFGEPFLDAGYPHIGMRKTL